MEETQDLSLDPPGLLLALEADPSLRGEPRLFTDPVLMASVHAELSERFGASRAAAALLQLGFLHGLRDATLLVRTELLRDSREELSTQPPQPRIALQFAPEAGDPRAGVRLTGHWPDQLEAEACSGALSPPPHPTCFVSAGYTSGWLSALFERDVVAVETHCGCLGHDVCRFDAREVEDWLAENHPGAALSLESLNFAGLRKSVSREFVQHPDDANHPGFDSSAAVVQIWGPVMIIPFSGGDDSVAAVELIRGDPAARDVSVVILDMNETILDPAFGALALERILEAIDRWGADLVLTGLSPLSEPVVADLQERHFLVHKDLPGAIAAAFQIAENQRIVS